MSRLWTQKTLEPARFSGCQIDDLSTFCQFEVRVGPRHRCRLSRLGDLDVDDHSLGCRLSQPRSHHPLDFRFHRHTGRLQAGDGLFDGRQGLDAVRIDEAGEVIHCVTVYEDPGGVLRDLGYGLNVGFLGGWPGAFEEPGDECFQGLLAVVDRVDVRELIEQVDRERRPVVVEAVGEVMSSRFVQFPGLEFRDEQFGQGAMTGWFFGGRFEVDGLQVLVREVVAGGGSVTERFERAGDR